MLPAIFGLLGVLVGAIATGTATFILARREERANRLAAVRLLCTDLHKTRAIIDEVRAAGVWGSERSELPSGAFALHSAVLARTLPANEWKYVEGAVLGVQRLELLRVQSEDESRDLAANEIDDFRRIGAFIDRALAALDAESSAIDHSDGYQGHLWRD